MKTKKKTNADGREKAQEAQRFFGQTYMYPTPNDGVKECGVVQSTRGFSYVGFIGNDGRVHKINSSNFPTVKLPGYVQEALDVFAKKRGLTPATPAVESAVAP